MTITIDRPTMPEERIAAVDWTSTRQARDDTGYATVPPLLTADECRDLRALYDDDSRFRNRIDMARYRFGVGGYKYFAAPLPPLIQELRTAFYPQLASVANHWMEQLGDDVRYPLDLPSFLDRCHLPLLGKSLDRDLPYLLSRARPSRRRCSCAMRRAATTVSTRISTGQSRSRSRCSSCLRDAEA